MPRPQRIEYPDAYYHVMNRGRGRQKIFHDEAYCQAFLETIKEANSRFGMEVQAYCLMGNHYHLLIKTPLGNLSRCMRHVNGVYTQRYNRLKNTDGPLFRGRFKAVLVEGDAYLLQLTRYIHRNPMDMKRPLVTELAAYPWSSYPAYLNKSPSPLWLNREFSYQLLGKKNRYQAYKSFVEQGVDEEILTFYGKGNLKPILGGDEFIESVLTEIEINRPYFNKLQGRLPAISTIVSAVAQQMRVEEKSIYTSARGRGSANIPRWIALFLSREVGKHPLNEIGKAFGMTHISGVAQAVKSLDKAGRDDKNLCKTKNILIHHLTS